MADKAKLTKRVVENIAPESGKRVIVWDTEVTGFGVRVSGSTRTYFVRYRAGAGGRGAKRVDYTIGRHGAPYTVDRARQEARSILGKVAEGTDPQQEKVAARQPRESRDFASVARLFLERHAKRNLQPTTWREYERIIERELIPAWGERQVGEIDRAAVIAVLDTIEDRAPVMARLTFATARKLFGFAVERGLIESNPCDGLRGPAVPKARDRVLTEAEIRTLWKATAQLDWPFGPAVRFLLLTGQRREEVSAMTWAEVDFERGVWTIPAARAKNGQAHEVDLSDRALEVLRLLPRHGDYAFGAWGDRPLQGWSQAKRRLDKAMAELAERDGVNVPAPWRIHDLRRTAATGIAGLGFPPHVVERVLNHMSGAQGGLVAVYQHHEYRAERKAALEAWAGRVDRIIGQASGDNVVQLQAGK